MRVQGTIGPTKAALLLGRDRKWLEKNGNLYCREQKANGGWLYGVDADGQLVPVIPS